MAPIDTDDHVVMISDTLWKRRFAADPEIVRKTITLNSDSYEVVGVLPADFHFPKLSHLYAMVSASGVDGRRANGSLRVWSIRSRTRARSNKPGTFPEVYPAPYEIPQWDL